MWIRTSTVARVPQTFRLAIGQLPGFLEGASTDLGFVLHQEIEPATPCRSVGGIVRRQIAEWIGGQSRKDFSLVGEKLSSNGRGVLWAADDQLLSLP
jgi:hypothetical protein